MTGLSRANLFFMRKFAEIIQQFHKEKLSDQIVYQAGGQLEDMPFFNIPWRHNVVFYWKNLLTLNNGFGMQNKSLRMVGLTMF